MSALAQDVRDADAVVCRAESAFREEDHGSWRRVVGHRPRRSSGQRPVHRARLSLSSGLAIVSITDRVVNWRHRTCAWTKKTVAGCGLLGAGWVFLAATGVAGAVE